MEADLDAALCRLQTEVTPLLAREEDACHIIPGRVRGDEDIACWSAITTEMRLPGIDIRGLHDLSHPLIGKAEGTTKNRIKLEDNNSTCSLILEKANWKTDGTEFHATSGIRATLKLNGDMLQHFVQGHGTLRKIRGHDRLIRIKASAFPSCQNRIMSRLEGYYLPIPKEWTGMGKAVANFKVIALTSQLTSLPIPGILSNYVDLAKPSKPTVKKLIASVQAAQEGLKPIPASDLFTC